MSQKHLYGINYDEMNPPVEWQSIQINATINDNAVDASVNNTELTFVGDSADFIQNTWIPQYGVFNGVPYRITMTSPITGDTITAFDGFIDISMRVIMSKSAPIIFRAPIIDLTNNITVFDKMSVTTQGLLVKKGFITWQDAVDIPVIRESKKNIAERTVILSQLGYQAVTLMIQAIQNFLSAISDITGLSLPIGLVELALLAVNTTIQINLFIDSALKHKDLFFPEISYYKGMSIKKTLEKAFAYHGMTVEFDTLLDLKLSNTYLMPSQDNNNGFPMPNWPETGKLNRRDWGYRIGEILQTVQDIGNTRQDVRGTVAHIRNKKDLFWLTAPLFQPDNVVIESTQQYQNGTKKENTENVDAVVYIAYAYDSTDTHTLTDNLDDAYEIHRELINELDPRMNTLKGIKDIQIPYAIAVRKTAFDNLFDLFTGISAQFDTWLSLFQQKIDQFTAELASSGVDFSALINASPFSSLISNRTGTLKIDDNSFALAKMVYLTNTSNGLRIPENHKEIIGAKAIYVDAYLSDSPADVNEFKGQYINWTGWRIPFGVDDFIKTKLNPYFELDGINIKFTSIQWIEQNHAAITDVEANEPFDTNITEEEI